MKNGLKKSHCRWLTAVVMLLSLTLLTAGCGTGKIDTPQESGEAQPASVTFMLDWTPNTNHTGLYVAQEKGYFVQQKLDVKIIQPSSQGTLEQLVAAGQADFGISAQEQVTNARIQGLPLISIATILQHNTSGFASLATENIQTAKGFEGRTYGGWGMPSEEATLKALMQRENVDFSKVKMINIGDADQLISMDKGDIDFTWIFYGWTGIQAEVNGKQLNMIWLKDVDPALDYYTPVIVTSEAMIQQKPEVVRRLMQAVSQGYQYAAQNPEEAADILIKNAPEIDPDLVKKSQTWLSPQYQAEAVRWGEQKASVWKNYAQWLYDRQLIEKMIDTDQAFTNDFLPK